MKVRQAAEDVSIAQSNRLPLRQWLFLDDFRQAGAFDQIHREVMQAIDLAYAMHAYDARVLQFSGRFGFPAKPFNVRSSGKFAGADRLEGYVAFQSGVPSLVNHSHATTQSR